MPLPNCWGVCDREGVLLVVFVLWVGQCCMGSVLALCWIGSVLMLA